MLTRYRLLLLVIFLLMIPFIRAQVDTMDYLTYSDENPEGLSSLSKWKITNYIFGGLNGFDENGHLISSYADYDTFSVWYVYFFYRLYNGKYLKINAAIQGWAAWLVVPEGVYVDDLTFWAGGGTPWLCANIKPSASIPLWFRIGYKFGKIGDSFRIDDNQFDLGISYAKRWGFVTLESLASYRIRTRTTDTEVLHSREWVSTGDADGIYDQAGNEIHYKLEPAITLSENVRWSMILLGYHSGNKKYRGQIVPNSESFKTALGSNFSFYRNKIALGFLWDFKGRYEEKGFTIVFNICH